MRLRRRRQSEDNGSVTEVVVTQTDQIVLSMSGAAERLRALDKEMLSSFIEWRAAQKRCLEDGLIVEVQMAEPMRAAYQTWLAEQYRPASEPEAETGIIHTAERGGAGEPHSQVHGWPLRMMHAEPVTVW
jgi:hypothetical protein